MLDHLHRLLPSCKSLCLGWQHRTILLLGLAIFSQTIENLEKRVELLQKKIDAENAIIKQLMASPTEANKKKAMQVHSCFPLSSLGILNPISWNAQIVNGEPCVVP